MDGISTRVATVADAALITAHRCAMFTEIGKSDPAAVEEMARNFMPWVARMIAAKKYVGWIVEEDGRPAASGGFFELEWPPHWLDPGAGGRGYLANFWVEPEYRGRGIAKMLTRLGTEESRRRGLRVTVLHASAAGRPVYEAVGFQESNEMMLVRAGER